MLCALAPPLSTWKCCSFLTSSVVLKLGLAMSQVDRERTRAPSHARSTSGSQHALAPSPSFRWSTESSLLPEGVGDQYGEARRDGYKQHRHGNGHGNDNGMEDDYLSPMSGAPRRARARVDSVASVGSSVAPVGLPRWQQARNRSSSRHQQREGSSSTAHMGHSNLPNSSSAMSLSTIGGSGGGLEAWLQSQAVGQAALSHDQFNSLAPSGRVRRMNAVDEGGDDIGSDTGRSIGAKSAGPMMNGTGSGRRKKEGRYRSPVPDWDPSVLDADAAGLGGIGMPDSQSKLDSVLRWRRDSTSKSVTKERSDMTDFDSQIAPERRRRKRDVGPGSFSASGLSVLREGVRKPGISHAEPSLDALLSSTRAGSAMLSTPGERESLAATGRSGISARSTETVDSSLSSPIRDFVRWYLFEGARSSTPTTSSLASGQGMLSILTTTILASVLLKWITGLGSWSGKGNAPMFGDLEAQRHWMEITLHLPRSLWYFYDLQYWGLDYPPLTAIVSQWCAKVVLVLLPNLSESLALDSSRGDESPSFIIYMRATVLVLDLLTYTPAVLFFLSRKLRGRGRRTRAIAALSVLLQPSLLLVDYGHFQYNNIMLGFSAASFALLSTSLPNPNLSSSTDKKEQLKVRQMMSTLSRRVSYEYIAAAVFFSLSLCFKQMALYFAPAIFAVMLGRCYGLAKIGFERGLTCFCGIGLATSLTFVIVFYSWITDLTQLGQIIHRIFPLARGLFEDKVSNIWCFLSVLPLPARYKLRNVMSVEALARLSLASTILVILLPCAQLFAAAVETVRIEMFLDQDMQRQITASEQRKKEASVTGSTRARERPRTQSRAAASDAGTDLASILSGHRGNSTIRGTQANFQGAKSHDLPQKSAVASSSPSPASSVLPYALLSTSLAFFLFGFQTHEKSILLPLLPLTLLITSKGDEWGGGAGKTDWEWIVLTNNLATFSMWPLLQRDGLTLQYTMLLPLWNWAIGHRPLSRLWSSRNTFVAWFGAAVHVAMLLLHLVEAVFPLAPDLTSAIIARYPDLFPVLNVLLCTPCFCLVWLWSMKRQMEIGFACGIDAFSLRSKSNSSKR